jgi:hypothetical protein
MYVLCINIYIYTHLIYVFHVQKYAVVTVRMITSSKHFFFVLTCRITQVPSLSFAPSTVASSDSEGNVSVEYGWIVEE